LRFLKFNRNWTRYKANDILITFPTNSLSWDLLSYENISDLKNLHYGLIHNGFSSSCIDGLNPLFPYINSEYLPSKYELLKNGDLILADASEDRKDVGRPVEIIDIKNQNIVAGLHTIHARDNTNLIIHGYKSFYFQSKAMKQQLYKVSNGSKIFGISPSVFKELIILIPCKEEQEKIVNLLRKLEDKIETQNKIISSLESQRKGIINILLKQLKSFNELSLSEILIEFNKKTTTNNEFPVLSSTASGIHLQSDYFNKEASSDDTTGYKILPKNYGTYRSMSDTGRFNFNQQTLLDYGIVSPAYPVFYSNTYNLSFVILYLNNSSEIKKQILELKTGGTRFALSFQKLCTLNIPNISLKQQNNVMQIMNSIDLKIQNENNLLNLYNRQKDYLLNNLFV
jgi:Restriction endonuclease S subunits